MEKLKTAYQYIIPQHGITRLVGKLASSKNKRIKSAFINYFLNNFDIKLSEALIDNSEDFATFNEFFTRELKPGIRPIAEGSDNICSPVDGKVSQLGDIKQGEIFQAKGHSYTLNELLGEQDNAITDYQAGKFSTIYLAPKDYHRIHMPMDAELKSMTFVPGSLFSVNPITARTIPRLFARNERLVAHFDTASGPMAMVLVGATIVGSIATVWSGVITPPRGKTIQRWQYEPKQHCFKKGDEMGRFLLGSTVILIYGKDHLDWESKITTDSVLVMGQKLGTIKGK